MTTQAIPKQHFLQINKSCLIAGLQWQYLPIRGRKNMRLRAQEKKANYWSALAIGEKQTQGTLLGTGNITDTQEIKRGTVFASMALTVLPNFSQDCYAVFQLSEDKYWFIAITDRSLSPFGDVVGDKTTINAAINTFLQVTPIPEGGWVVYAPSGFFNGIQTEELELLPLLTNKTNIKRARLYKTHNQQSLWLWGSIAIVLCGAYVAHDAWEKKKSQTRIEAAQAALFAQQENRTNLQDIKPWHSLPAFPYMIEACSKAWKNAPISIAGWIFNSGQCDNTGNITFLYTLTNGGTVEDFANRLPLFYGGNTKPTFNIPGGADNASFTVPFQLPAGHTESLLSGDQQIQNLTSYAQRTNAKLRLVENSPPTQVIEGEVHYLPFRTYDFTFITNIPPERLFSSSHGFNSSGVRATSIAISLNNNQLEYSIEGTLYVVH
ncbi:type 4b pilus protein PilO2 (plasmid) [Xenorhabdus stockiae]|uniref:type 4b pilus protein PilO2 n=1 Tax=Xenorhabdus stockiae TaxID=351614 RepID=UPI003CFA0AF8